MPKKKSSSKKRKIKEIKKEKKEIKKKIEESDLEKDIEKTEEVMEESEFREFLQPTPVSAPVLTKVETFIQEPLESNIASSSITETKEETGIDYVTRNEPKYSDTLATNDEDEKKYESEFRPPTLSQAESREFRQETLTPQREAGTDMRNIPEGIETTTLEQKRREPFETQEKKYREVKF